ncbi:MAG: hypothetical protein ACOZCO_14905 [Bacteroidota bacterium]
MFGRYLILLVICFSVPHSLSGAKEWSPAIFDFHCSPGGRFWNITGSYYDYFSIIYDSKKEIFIHGDEIGLNKYYSFNCASKYSENEKWASDGEYFYDTETWERKKINYHTLIDTNRFQLNYEYGNFKNNLFYSHIQCKSKSSGENYYSFFITDPENGKFIWQYGPDSLAYDPPRQNWNKNWLNGKDQNYFYLWKKLNDDSHSQQVMIIDPFTDILCELDTFMQFDYFGSGTYSKNNEFVISSWHKDMVDTIGLKIKRFPHAKFIGNDISGKIFYIMDNDEEYWFGCDLYVYDPANGSNLLIKKNIADDEILISPDGKCISLPHFKHNKGYNIVYSYPEMKELGAFRHYLFYYNSTPRYILDPNGKYYASPSKNNMEIDIYSLIDGSKKTIKIPYKKTKYGE